MRSAYVPDGCPLSPWEDEPEDVCPMCGAEIVPGCPHAACRDEDDFADCDFHYDFR